MLLIGTVIGTAIAGVALAGANGALTGSVAISIPPDGYLLVLLGVLALGMVATLIPALMTLRNRPIAALGSAA